MPVATVVNPQTDSLRRDNHMREVITQPTALSQSAAEKGVASDKDKAKTPAQNNEQVDLANIRKRAEREETTITDSSDQDGESSSDAKQDEKGGRDPNSMEAFAEEREIKELKQTDRQVRSHEMAHASVGGATTGAPSYTFEVGPDGKKYAIGGEVSVDMSIIKGNPRATIAKMQKVHAAALAPANPSIQDTRVAAQAAKAIVQAQSELAAQQANGEEEASGSSATAYTKQRDVLDGQGKGQDNESDFDTMINQTLESQERIAPQRSQDVIDRAQRIETFYSNINHAYEKPSSHQFQLMA